MSRMARRARTPAARARMPLPHPLLGRLIGSLHEWQLEIAGDGPDLGDLGTFVPQ